MYFVHLRASPLGKQTLPKAGAQAELMNEREEVMNTWKLGRPCPSCGGTDFRRSVERRQAFEIGQSAPYEDERKLLDWECGVCGWKPDEDELKREDNE